MKFFIKRTRFFLLICGLAQWYSITICEEEFFTPAGDLSPIGRVERNGEGGGGGRPLPPLAGGSTSHGGSAPAPEPVTQEPLQKPQDQAVEKLTDYLRDMDNFSKKDATNVIQNITTLVQRSAEIPFATVTVRGEAGSTGSEITLVKFLKAKIENTTSEPAKSNYQLALKTLLGTSLTYAKTTEEVGKLLEAGADINYQYPGIGDTLLMYALIDKNNDIVKLLIDNAPALGLNPLLVNNEGKSALDLAEENSSPYVQPLTRFVTAYKQAQRFSFFETIKVLLKKILPNAIGKGITFNTTVGTISVKSDIPLTDQGKLALHRIEMILQKLQKADLPDEARKQLTDELSRDLEFLEKNYTNLDTTKAQLSLSVSADLAQLQGIKQQTEDFSDQFILVTRQLFNRFEYDPSDNQKPTIDSMLESMKSALPYYKKQQEVQVNASLLETLNKSITKTLENLSKNAKQSNNKLLQQAADGVLAAYEKLTTFHSTGTTA